MKARRSVRDARILAARNSGGHDIGETEKGRCDHRQTGLDQLALQTEIAERANQVSLRGPGDAVPRGLKIEQPAILDNPAHFYQRLLGLGDVFQHPNGPQRVELTVAERHFRGGGLNERLVIVRPRRSRYVQAHVAVDQILKVPSARAYVQNPLIPEAELLYEVGHSRYDLVMFDGILRDFDVIGGVIGGLLTFIGVDFGVEIASIARNSGRIHPVGMIREMYKEGDDQ